MQKLTDFHQCQEIMFCCKYLSFLIALILLKHHIPNASLMAQFSWFGYEIWCFLWRVWPLQQFLSLKWRSIAAGKGLDLLCWGHSFPNINAI
jgi:hypothetical protein